MVFLKVIKNKAYFKRFQVKFLRRRQGVTDYYARKRLTIHDKNKYNTPKYRLVVRVQNKNITVQVAYATLTGDRIMESAYSSELKNFGVKAGLTNYAASYATGLLCARRLLAKHKLDTAYVGTTEVTGGDFSVVDQENGPRAFRCFLDIGLQRTTTGAKILGALKGAVDGGLSIPHGNTRFPGYESENKKLNEEVHRNYIFGVHVSEYMELLADEDPDSYKTQFASYISKGIKADKVEDMWAAAHEAIRANPSRQPKKVYTGVPRVIKGRKARISLAQRKGKVAQKKAAFKLAQAA
jgi:large subunit ribosomal protein L5e